MESRDETNVHNENARRKATQAKLQQLWGYRQFRPPQAEIIDTILTKQDALVILPTGGGKSICFQLPALLTKGLTLVVSPLVALMENQAKQLQQRGLPGALFHSELPRAAKTKILWSIKTQQLDLLYLSPETLISQAIWSIISQPQINISAIMIDEAHCLRHWGTTFRPAYRRLGAVRRSLLQQKPPQTKIAIAAFTATADSQTKQEIIQTLELNQPKTFLVSPYRANLSLNVKTTWTPRSRKQQMLQIIQNSNNQSGLVYVRTRTDSQAIAAWFKSLGYKAAAYHAGLVTTAKRKIEQDWIWGKIQLVVCTSAFGMGIDKSSVRFVIHYQAPELLAEYIQEIGRGGRDGQSAQAFTLISEPTGLLNPEDRQRSQFLKSQREQQYRQAQQLLKQLPHQGEIAVLRQQFPQLEISLGICHSLGLVHWQNPFFYSKCSATQAPRNLIYSHRTQQLQMERFLKTKQCRWQFILQAFDFNQNPAGFQCGNCDNCSRVKR